MKIYVAEQYDSHHHDYAPIQGGHHTTLDGAKKAAVAACPLPLKWAEPWTNGRGNRCWRAEEVEDLERDDGGYLPPVLPSDFMVREVELIHDEPSSSCELCGGSKRAPVVDFEEDDGTMEGDLVTPVLRYITCPLCEEGNDADQG